jgi:membrane-bound lytic murein transglycosylase B
MHIVFATFFLLMSLHAGDFDEYKAQKRFIDRMVKKHNFKRAYLEALFNHVKRDKTALKLIKKPPKMKRQKKHGGWDRYAKILLSKRHVEGGVTFWKKYKRTIHRASKKYRVDPEIIVAIIGVESLYGSMDGDFSILNVLATIGFDYPRRSKFFLNELEKFILMCYRNGMDPLKVEGSFAGAMGYGQFMPSSYFKYAVDFNGDGIIDMWNPVDMIGSVANYFKKSGWRQGGEVTVRARYKGSRFSRLNTGFKTRYSQKRLRQKYGITPRKKWRYKKAVSLIRLDRKKYDELWLGAHNFFVITRYNRSSYYAMAVYRLAKELKRRVG